MSPSLSDVAQRDATIDVAKGLAIGLVVLAHVDRGLFAADVLSVEDFAGWLDLWLYSFFIPLFVFLAGLFMATSADRLGLARFTRIRVSDLLWLYVVWSLINGLMQMAFNRFTSGDTSLFSVLALWSPQGTMWFLPSLAFATAIVALSAPWRSRLRVWTVLGILLLVAIFTWRDFAVWPLDWLNPQLAFFLALGATMGHDRLSYWLNSRSSTSLLVLSGGALVAMVALLAAGAAVPSAAVATDDGLVPRLAGIACAVLGIVVVLGVSVAIARHVPPATAVLALLGRRSLAIYVSHTVFTAGARAVLVLAGVSWSPAYVLLGVAAGLLGPILLYSTAQRFGWTWLFARPRIAVPKAAVK